MFLNGGAGKDTLTGGTDADTLYGNGGDDKLTGNAGDDVLTGGAGNDTALGGDGDDYLMGDAGNDRLDGGAGSDWAGYESATAAVKVDLSLTSAQNTGGGGTDTLLNIENLYGTTYADTLTGSSANNMLFGGAGNDTIFGAAGDDFLAGGAGNDTLSGGDGDDTVSYDDGDATGVVVNLATGVATGHGTDTLISVESVYSGAGDDNLTGSAGDNYLGGGAGNDTISAGGGADFVEGGAGNNVLAGGDGVDTLSYQGSSQSVTVFTEFGRAYVGPLGTGSEDQVSGFENIIGSDYRDQLEGDAGSNLLMGGGGDDDLRGNGGADTLDGGDGADRFLLTDRSESFVILGGEGKDQLVLSQLQPGGSYVIDLAVTGPQDIGGGHIVTLQSVENVGSATGNTTIYASTATNEITGWWGNDRYVARTLDELGHGDDADMLIYANGHWTVDISAIDADTTQAGDQAFHLLADGQGFTGHAGEVMARQSNGAWSTLEFDVNGDGFSDGSLRISFSTHPLSEPVLDFIL